MKDTRVTDSINHSQKLIIDGLVDGSMRISREILQHLVDLGYSLALGRMQQSLDEITEHKFEESADDGEGGLF